MVFFLTKYHRCSQRSSIQRLHRRALAAFSLILLVAPSQRGARATERAEKGGVACQARFVHQRQYRAKHRYRSAKRIEPFQFEYAVEVSRLEGCHWGQLKVALDHAEEGWTLEPLDTFRSGETEQLSDEYTRLQIAQLTYEQSQPKSGLWRARLKLLDGQRTLDQLLVVLDLESKWHGTWMPGVHGAYYRPNGAEVPQGSDAEWLGVALEYVLWAWIHKNNNRGPSIGKFSWVTSLLSSSQRPELAMIYGVRSQLSFERNPTRNLFIPHFGFELGGIYLPAARDEPLHHFQVSPTLGVDLFSLPSGFLSLSTGYLISGVGALESLRGWRAQAGLHFTLW